MALDITETELQQELERYLSGLTDEEDRNVFTISEAQRALGLSRTATRLRLRDLMERHVIEPAFGRKRNAWGQLQRVKAYRFNAKEK